MHMWPLSTNNPLRPGLRVWHGNVEGGSCSLFFSYCMDNICSELRNQRGSYVKLLGIRWQGDHL